MNGQKKNDGTSRLASPSEYKEGSYRRNHLSIKRAPVAVGVIGRFYREPRLHFKYR